MQPSIFWVVHQSLFRQHCGLIIHEFVNRETAMLSMGGYPPFPLFLGGFKIGLKTVFFGQKTLFLAEIFSNSVRYGGGDTPQFR